MNKITKNNLLKLVDMKKEYLQTRNESLLLQINDFIDNVVNQDRRYYHKLESYDFSKDVLDYLI